jgi:hypothetical protein
MTSKMRERWIHFSFESCKAVNAGSHDPTNVDGKFLGEILLNAF